MLWKVAEIVDEISSSEYAIDHRLSRFRWIPPSSISPKNQALGGIDRVEPVSKSNVK
jgi:hypothetical protein